MNAIFVVCGLGVITLLAEIVNMRRWLVALIAAGLAAAALVLSLDWNTTVAYYHDMVVFNNFSIAFGILILATSAAWFWMANAFFDDAFHRTDKLALVVFAVVGALLMASFNNLAMLFVGLEILSISLYALTGSRRDSFQSNEAAFKYFLMGSFATGFMLMGIALIYGATGSFDLLKINAFMLDHSGSLPGFFYVGVLMVFIGLVFKMSAVPFHFWAPDVYTGSPTVITAFMATVVKMAAVAAFYKIFGVGLATVSPTWSVLMQVITVLTLVVANVTAVYQTQVKRMLAYSSVGHVGYIMLVLLSGEKAANTLLYYLAAYAAASITAFAVVQIVERDGDGAPTDNFNGLFKKDPFLAVSMTIALLSLAGIPPLAGFFGKYMVFAQAIEAGFGWIIILAVLTSLVGVFYYFKAIVAMYFRDGDRVAVVLPTTLKVLLFISVAITILLGVLPDVVMGLLAV